MGLLKFLPMLGGGLLGGMAAGQVDPKLLAVLGGGMGGAGAGGGTMGGLMGGGEGMPGSMPEQSAIEGFAGAGMGSGPEQPMGAPEAPQHHGFFSKGSPGRSFVANLMGGIGDTLAHNNNWASSQQDMRQSQMTEDRYQSHRKDSFEDWKAQQDYEREHPKSDKPALFREYELYNSLPPDQRPNFENFMHMRNPVQPLIMGQYDRMEGAPPAPTGGGETTATNPQTGEKMRLNPQTNQWEPMGGPSPQGSGGF